MGDEGQEFDQIDLGRLQRALETEMATAGAPGCDSAPGSGRFLALLARDESGTTVGVLTLSTSFAIYAGGEYGVIDEMYVRPECRSQGVGRKLVEAAMGIARQRGWFRLDVTGPVGERRRRCSASTGAWDSSLQVRNCGCWCSGRSTERLHMTEWYRLSADEALEQTQSDPQGLADDEAARRLDEHGPNELIDAGTKSPWRILAEQFTSLLIIILIIAAVVSALLGDYEDAIVIMAIVILNGALGFRQEYKAEKTMTALRKLAAPIVRVRRGGEVREVPAAELVPGDIVLLEAGNVIPADARLLRSASLRVQEAALTGESEPVEKTADRLPESDVALGDRLNMLFMGTAASYGRGEAVVTATGMDTELGKIAGMVQGVKQSRTPLQKRLSQLGRWLAVAALILVIIIFVTGLLRGEPLRIMFLTAVSMAVAAVPEGLPAIVTVALSLGAQRMLRRKALIRKLPAVETLGSVTVICSDKTGTLTENRMTVVILDVAGHEVDLQEEMERGRIAPLPCAAAGDDAPLMRDKPAVAVLVAGGVLCNDSVLQTSAGEGVCEDAGASQFRALGDPTEGALVIAGVHLGLLKTELEKTFPRTGEIPFDSERKLMTTVHAAPAGPVSGLEALAAHLAERRAGQISFTKGAPEALLPLATSYWDGERALPLDEATRSSVEERNRSPRFPRDAGAGGRLPGARGWRPPGGTTSRRAAAGWERTWCWSD